MNAMIRFFGDVKQRLKRTSPVRFFLVTGAVFGLGFIAITPPLQGADEAAHYFRAYQISQGNMMVDASPAGFGGELPASLNRLEQIIESPSVKFYPQLKYDGKKTLEAFNVASDEQKKRFYQFSATAQYPPVPYLPASLGILVARILPLPELASLYAGRLASLAAWLAIVAAAIALMPSRKWAMAVIGLLPMALFQAATINTDVLTIGSLMIFVAAIMRLREHKVRVGRWWLAALLAITTALVLSKQIMFVFLPLLLLIPRVVFGSKRRAIIIRTALAAIPLLLFGAWMLLVSGLDITSNFNNGQNTEAQMDFVLHNPHSFINVLWNTYFYTWGDTITRSFVGVFGWADTPLSEIIVTATYIGLFLLLFAQTDTAKRAARWFKRSERWLLIAMIVAYFLAVSASLYVYYTPAEFKIISGIQGRYFLPLAVLVLLLAKDTRFLRMPLSSYKRLAFIMPLVLLFASTITLYVRYYINNV